MLRSRRALIVLLAVVPHGASAQADTSGIGAAVLRARTALRGLTNLWGPTAGRIDWLFVSRSGALRTRGTAPLETVTLPPDAPRANTSYTLDGKRVAMVLLPLTPDVETNARLLLHEAMHTLQPEYLPHPGGTEPMDGGDLLDRADGRIWLFLELRALATALTSKGAQRAAAAHDALAFRAQRDSLASPQEQTRLDALDIAEGIPEYTSWRLVKSPLRAFTPDLTNAHRRAGTWVRSVAYSTAPAYGFLLDQLRAPGWHARWRTAERLPRLLRDAIGADASRASVEARAARYDGAAIIATERAREAERTRKLEALLARYVRLPVLRVVPRAMQVTFDPNGQVPLGNHGTVMANFRWSSSDGAELAAPAGALVSSTWSHVQVPLGTAQLATGVVTAAIVVTGDGWQLKLPIGWMVTRNGDVTEVRPPSP